MEYIVFKSGGKQHKSSVGDILDVDKILGKKDDSIVLDNVMLWVNEGNIKIGKPSLTDVKVHAKILDQFKGKKLTVRKFKAKSRYRRTTGFRPQLTKLKIEKIEVKK
jgi:large subunit ribosomal protein L21